MSNLTCIFIIVNIESELFNDKQGEFTFSSQRDLSVTDIVLLHVNNVNSLNNFHVEKKTIIMLPQSGGI